MTVSHFAIVEDEHGASMRLALTGELDLAAVPVLDARLADARAAERTVCLDLSNLEFIDSTGLQALVRAIDDAHTNGWHLQIGREVAPQVMRLFELVGVEGLIPGYDSTRS